MEGRAYKEAHRVKAEEDKEKNGVPRISMDYFYLRQRGDEAKEFPLIVVVNEESGEKFARATGKKGVGDAGECDWVIKELSEEMKTWGHAGGTGGKIILKCDRERALLAFRNALGRYHGGVIIPEEPAKNESQSNGAAETAGKLVREFVRVLKQQMEATAEVKLQGDDPVIQWMIRWAAMLVSRYLVGKVCLL